ncbi:MAG: hypothetical protein IJ455_01680 [Agathobacter sp.]|nr:hypothetical protein [Agathobacter sp.]
MELIILIVIISYIVKAVKKANENETRYNNANKNSNPWEGVAYQAPKQATRINSARVQVQQQTKEAVQEQLERTKQRILASRGMQSVENENAQQANQHRQQENRQAMQQVHASRMEARNTSIIDRAKKNTDEDKADVTLETMEAEHNHSERVSAAVHHHPEDIIPENMLGTVEDLMVKGYDGNLCFERDFVGEGLDMISRFSYQ